MGSSALVLSMELEAAKQLAIRPDHLSGVLTDSESQEHQMLFSRLLPEEWHHDTGTAASIKWQPHFKWVQSVKINRRDGNTSLKPKTLHLYGHIENDFLYFTGYEDRKWAARLSNAKLMLSINPYEDSRFGYVFINAISTNEYPKEHLLGSALIQLAIEYSLIMGYEGRVKLKSVRDSGLFYFKLGFVSENHETYAQLQQGKEMDGGDMYLPSECIKIWKAKIEKTPLLPAITPELSLKSPIIPLIRPPSDKSQTIREIVTELIENIELKRNNRSSWFNVGTDNKTQQLKEIRDNLSDDVIDPQAESETLTRIRDVCAMKRNKIGFFEPHSLTEFNKLVRLSFVSRL